MKNIFLFFLQKILPKKLITKIFSFVLNQKLGRVTTFMIKMFIKFYSIELLELRKRNIKSYLTFAEFFTRKIKKESRPINKEKFSIVSPVDGIITEYGFLKKKKIFFVKNKYIDLRKILNFDKNLVQQFSKGSYTISYLSPKNYHRVHMCYSGFLKNIVYSPGEFFSVNPKIIKIFPKVLIKNEKVICVFQCEFGIFIKILVGAIIVGGIKTIWNKKEFFKKKYSICKKNKKNFLKKGQEIAKFEFGSTVISLFSKRIAFEKSIICNKYIKMGEKIATFKNS
ncbi:archaetidylserine decarboxylase [bacterium endosymbiont of Pedicinus badii]|uniref:archaetidylserine decarboxylase n=1 Tax=bacterium endosymbiont of Pedicinus badii TaxID=1719126 RepID=UPI0009BA00C9|nr:archaetidylserine decarboxylase [bacterium endosymbiont of Pedicinus badii]OQM34174.1 hypothetical protein AOQ89_02440 [bacterium endosymbiont of Pedicinus badii]